jgi:hypothetical protein
VSDVSTSPLSEPQIAPVPAEPVRAVNGGQELPSTQVQTAATQSGDVCGSCRVPLAGDQRYCLECGGRRGDPRLPFMDAVVLMDAVKQPPQAPPPAKKKRGGGGISPNAALIAGVGVLLLALGIGVLIGRSGHQEVAQTAAAPQVIEVGGGGEEATASSGKGGKTTTGGGNTDLKSKKQKEAALKEAEKHPAAEEVLKPADGVKLPPSTVKPGDSCEPGAAGCEDGEFTGNFFE